MQFKKYLLTPLLFLNMWMGTGALVQGIQIEEKPVDILQTVKENLISEGIVAPEVEVKQTLLKKLDLLALIFASLFIYCFYFKNHPIKFTQNTKKITLNSYYFKNNFLNRNISKTKKAYYCHFYSSINIFYSLLNIK